MSGYPIPTGESAWIYKTISSMLGGVDYNKRPDELGDTQAVNLINVIPKKGGLINDTGYTPFLSTPIQGIVQLEYGWEQSDGSFLTVLITTKTVYQYNTTGPQWRLVQGTAATTIVPSGIGNGGHQPGEIIFQITSAAGFSSGDLVGIQLSNGQQHQSYITLSGTTVTLTTPLPSPTDSGAAFIRAVALNGSLDHSVSADAFEPDGWLVFTNGIDIVKKYDGNTCVDVPNLPSAGQTVCQAVCTYNASLFLLNTTEGGVNYPQRARRSDIGDGTNWTTNLAGKDDLLDKADPIVTARRLGPYMIVYRDHSIAQGSYVGAGGLNYQFITMIDNEGALSNYSVMEVVENKDNFHVVAGRSGLYKYIGNYTLDPLSDSIYERVWGTEGNMNPSRRGRTFVIYVKELKEIWLGYASVQSDVPDTVWRYSLTYKIWYQRLFANTFINASSFENITDILWTDLQGDWTNQPFTWESMVSSARATNIHLLSNAFSVSQVHSYDYRTTNDNGAPIQYTVETKDFLVPDSVIRFDQFEAYVQATGTEVHYSTDQGKSWNTLGTISNVPESRIRLNKQFLGQRVRFRFTGSDTNFLLEWFALQYKIETIYDFS